MGGSWTPSIGSGLQTPVACGALCDGLSPLSIKCLSVVGERAGGHAAPRLEMPCARACTQRPGCAVFAALAHRALAHGACLPASVCTRCHAATLPPPPPHVMCGAHPPEGVIVCQVSSVKSMADTLLLSLTAGSVLPVRSCTPAVANMRLRLPHAQRASERAASGVRVGIA